MDNPETWATLGYTRNRRKKNKQTNKKHTTQHRKVKR
jgi:hypothetical protein